MTTNSCLGRRHSPVVDADSKVRIVIRELHIDYKLAEAVYQDCIAHLIGMAVGVQRPHYSDASDSF